MRIYIGNLPFQATEGDLEKLFTDAGVAVDSVHIIRDRFSGEPRGFGFVEVPSDEEGRRAIQACNGKDFLGRTLVVNEARPPRTAGGGEGGGRRPPGGRGPGGGRQRF